MIDGSVHADSGCKASRGADASAESWDGEYGRPSRRRRSRSRRGDDREGGDAAGRDDSSEGGGDGVSRGQRLGASLTLESVLDLEARLPLSAAAAALGVSPAELRRACRRLGVRRWRHRAHAAAAAAAASPVARTVAYAANLRRRYALLASESLAQPPLTRPTPTSPIPAQAAG